MSENESDIDLELFGNVGEVRNAGISAETANAEKAELERQLDYRRVLLRELSDDATVLERARKQLDVAESLVALNRGEEAWGIAREAFNVAMSEESWQDAVEACNVLYQAEQPASIPALGMGMWLAVTFPVDPELTYTMMDHFVSETPANADGAALAAVTALYVIDMRASDEQHESLSFLATNLISRVAERHSQVKNQMGLDVWVEKLELKDPQVFLPRLSLVIGAIVEEQWWFDRDELRAKIPE
ncbi:MAG: hypothetical protein HUJ30_04345 [Gammaproteobacteria bacterium]|nr:hypothetical protein [Gammaproteobacteria bacterium]